MSDIFSKSIDNVVITNKKVLLRVDFNVSFDKEGEIIDDLRIKKSIPTIEKLLKQNNKIIIITHLGKPEDKDPKLSLLPIFYKLKNYLPDIDATFIKDIKDKREINKINTSKSRIFLLENIRYYEEELQNNNDFAQSLANMAQVFVNDAFSESHRNVASIASLPKLLPSYAGLSLDMEIKKLAQCIHNPKRPITFILGGAKISTKIKFIKKILSFADNLLTAGNIANTLLNAKGMYIKSTIADSASVDIGYDPNSYALAKEIISLSTRSSCNLILPQDAVIAKKNDLLKTKTVYVKEIPKDYNIYDIGPQAIQLYYNVIKNSQTIVWNGPLGLIEHKQFCNGTEKIFEAIINKPNLISVLGGGDTVSYFSKHKGIENITHISTGGGAMLEFIQRGTLPGIEALKESKT